MGSLNIFRFISRFEIEDEKPKLIFIRYIIHEKAWYTRKQEDSERGLVLVPTSINGDQSCSGQAPHTTSLIMENIGRLL